MYHNVKFCSASSHKKPNLKKYEGTLRGFKRSAMRSILVYLMLTEVYQIILEPLAVCEVPGDRFLFSLRPSRSHLLPVHHQNLGLL